MSSVTTTVADFYRFVVGVDTHAATHNYAIVAAPNGAPIDQATFPTTPAGLRRARDWIGRRTRAALDGVLVAAEGNRLLRCRAQRRARGGRLPGRRGTHSASRTRPREDSAKRP